MGDEALGRLASYIVERIEVGICVLNREHRVQLWNRFMAMHSGHAASEVLGRNLFEVFPELPRAWLEKKLSSVFVLKNYAFTSWQQRPYLFHFKHNRPVTGGADCMHQNCVFLPVKNEVGEVEQVCINVFDYTDTALIQRMLERGVQELEKEKREQQVLIKKLEDAHNQLLQSEKLASIGQLAAGVAHEINNPVGFVNSNLGTLDNYVSSLLKLVDAYQAGATEAFAAPAQEAITAARREADIEFLREDIGPLIKESKDGLDRVKRIVQDLKDFSRVGESDWQWADLHQCLDSTLNVVWNEIKYKAEVVKNYGTLPHVECLPSQLNQVFMNLVVNAAQAISGRGCITLATGVEGEEAWVSVSDTGGGIPEENLTRIFDPFFTTKPVGKGTGLGLSVSYSIVARHRGRIEVESTMGSGTTFRVFLPLTQREAQAVAA
jgi:signal transduction histidine kinase